MTYEQAKARYNPKGLAASLSDEPDGPRSIPVLYQGQVMYYTIYEA
jgi:hypothetical protein